MTRFLFTTLISLPLLGCHPRSCLLEPKVSYTPHPWDFSATCSAFPPLSEEEAKTEWGKELTIALQFAKNFDLYRAITGFKRALFLTPEEQTDTLLQIEYLILLSYYMGNKIEEAIYTFEGGPLRGVSTSFPPFRDLLVILYDCYVHVGQLEKARAILQLIEKGDAELAATLYLFQDIKTGALTEKNPIRLAYCSCKKSVPHAQFANALLPGAGYYYIGQKKTALTALLVNTFTTAAAWHFYREGNWGAGALMTSLEIGWYLGGINGAGLAAKKYNETLYQSLAHQAAYKQPYFPHLLLEATW